MSRDRQKIVKSHTLAMSVWDFIKKNLDPSPTFKLSSTNSELTTDVSPDVLNWRSYCIHRMYSSPKNV